MSEKPVVTKGLKKVLGLGSLFIITIGLVVSQASVVSILQGAGYGGGSFFIAIFIAFILTICYIATYSELALMMPKAGSISTYTAVSIGHFPAIIAAISAYIAPAIFAWPAELLLLQHVLDSIAPDSFTNFALLLLWFFTILNILGIDLFASIQSFISYTMLVTLLVIGFAGFTTSANGTSAMQIGKGLLHSSSSVFSLVLLALWAFISFEVVCNLIEEAKNPQKHLPKAMFLASITMLFVYSLIAFTAMRQVPSAQLANTDIPHWVLGKALFGNAGKIIIAVLAITTTSGAISSALAAIPRLLYGMAHHKQLPTIFMKLHPKRKTPWFGILVLSLLTTLPLLIFGKNPDALLMLLISAASCWLLTYIIAHIDLIVLRKKYPKHGRPFKSPMFPLLQVVGIAGMAYAFFNNAPTPELRMKVYINTAFFIGLTAIFAFLWIKYKMKKGLFEAEPIEQAIKD
ncbi:MAG: APC family permease [Bacteroidota bacterium]